MTRTSLVALTLALASPAVAADEYTFVLVDAFATEYGLRECYLYDIDESNQACGTATITIPWVGGWLTTYTGFYWDPVLEKTPIALNWPNGISDAGLVAGVAAVFDIASDTSIPMSTLPGTYFPLVLKGINDSGIAVGYVQTCNCSNSAGMLQIPYVWHPEEGAFTLPVPGATGASRINGQGKIVGWIGGNSSPNSYVYDLATDTYMIMSTVFEGANTKTTATDISETGVVVGSRMSSNGQITHGYTWSPETGVTLLPLPPAGFQKYVAPAGINVAGTVVGTIATMQGSQRAFVYDATHGVRDLNTLTTPAPGFVMNAATAVNDNGWIVGWGSGGGGMTRAFVLKPKIAGDLDGDGTVGPADLAILLGAWGTSGAGDLNGSGAVDGEDLGTLLASWSL
ncbi:MAG: hypothetical protein JNM94_05980 [Phycisphaerae bacterium]|nr:hypothetical protein [Phycisphaerae bacterium]